MEDEDEDEYEIEDDALIKHEEDHKKISDILLESISQREELVRLLKIARPEKMAELREAISAFDQAIEATENYLATIEDLIQKRRVYIENLRKGWIISEKLVKGFREKYADDPEKLEMLEALLEDDGSSH